MIDRERAKSNVRAIGERALQHNLARAQVLRQALDAVRARRLDEPLRRAAQRAAHQIAGSAGTFGHPIASELSMRLGEFFRRGGRPEQLPDADAWLEGLDADLASDPDDEDS